MHNISTRNTHIQGQSHLSGTNAHSITHTHTHTPTHTHMSCRVIGGPLPSIQLSAQQKGFDFSVRLTDLVPNPLAWKRTVHESEQAGLIKGNLSYVETSVDATGELESRYGRGHYCWMTI